MNLEVSDRNGDQLKGFYCIFVLHDLTRCTNTKRTGVLARGEIFLQSALLYLSPHRIASFFVL